MSTTIKTKSSTTASAVPTGLSQGELAVNIADKKVWVGDAVGNSVQIAGNGATNVAGGSDTQVQYNSSGALAGSSNMTFDGTTLSTLNLTVTGTGAVKMATGTTAQQPGTPSAGMLRFNTSLTQFEGYNGSSWASVGGATINNDTATSSNVYPLFAGATSGTALTVYTSNAKLLYKPSTGELQSTALIASNGMVLNNATISASYTIASGNNAMSSGPVSVASGVTVTVPTGSRWVVL